MLRRFWLMSDPLIRRLRSSYAMQAKEISLDIRFIPVEHTHSFVPKSPQLWLWPRVFCGATNTASKSGMHIVRQTCRPSCGRRHTTVITLPIPKSAPVRCIVGVSPSTPPWSTHGFATFACQRTLMILLPLQCCLTWVPLSKSAGTCVCCGTPCTRLVFAAYALNGGITPSLVGKNTCRPKKQRVPHKF